MPGMSQVGFGGGIAQGLARGLSAKRDREQQERQQQIQGIWKSIGFLMDSGQVQDVSTLQPHFDALASLGAFGDVKKKGKSGELGAQDHVTNILGRVVQAGQPLQPGPMAQQQQPAGLGPNDAGPREPDALPSRQIGSTGVPAAPQRTLRIGGMEIPVMSPEAASQAKTDRAITAQGQEIQAKIGLARRILPALQSVDPTANLDDALAAVGIRPPTAHTATPQSVAGEVNGKPAFAIFNGSSYVDPVTKQPMQGFAPRTTTGSTSLGQYAERAARELGFQSASAAGAAGPEAMKRVNDRAIELQAEGAGAVTTARGAAEIATPQKRFENTLKLQERWAKAEAPKKEMARQLSNMDSAIARYEQDPTGASEAIRVAFEKILDPDSVVREGEYARQAQGLSLFNRFEGFKQQLLSGGGNIPKPVLEGMIGTAKAFMDGMETYNDLIKEQIQGEVEEGKLDPKRIFGAGASSMPKPAPGKSGDKSKSTGMSMDKEGNIYVNGVKVDLK